MTSFLTWLYNANPVLQKTLASACMFMFLGFGVLIAFSLASGINSVIDENASKRKLLGDLQRVAALKKNIESSRPKANAYSDIFLPGETISVTGANLHSIVDGIATTNNIAISSVINLPVKEQAGVELVGLKLAIVGSLENIHKMIFGIETTSPPLLIGDLVIQNVLTQNKLVAPRISIDIEVFGAKQPNLPEIQSGEES